TILREEFDVPFLFQDAGTGDLVGEVRPSQEALDPAEVASLAGGGQVRVTKEKEGYRLAIPLYSSGKPILVGTGVLPSLSRTEADAIREQRQVEKWGQSVCERLRCSDYIVSHGRDKRDDSGQVKTAWEAILTLDHLLSHLRIHKNTAANQRRI